MAPQRMEELHAQVGDWLAGVYFLESRNWRERERSPLNCMGGAHRSWLAIVHLLGTESSVVVRVSWYILEELYSEGGCCKNGKKFWGNWQIELCVNIPSLGRGYCESAQQALLVKGVFN